MNYFLAADDHQTIIKVLFIDFRKAFEMIDHSILRTKLDNYEFAPQLSAWMLSFLTERMQFVKIDDSMSDVCIINAGAPQGTRAGPNDFKVLITV